MRRLRRRDGAPPEIVRIIFDGKELPAHAGEPVAAALLADRVRGIRRQFASGRPRGIYCGIGHCFDCVATVDGVPGVRTCLTPVRDGMDVRSATS